MSNRTTTSEDRSIGQAIAEEFDFEGMDWSFLLRHIQDLCNPEDIFDGGELDDWAIQNDYFTKDQIFQKFDPEEIYDRQTLQEWAENNGFVKDV